jgi:hypothetical protein
MEILYALVPVFKGVPWPAAAFGIAFLFRHEVRALFKRIRQVEGVGLKVQMGPGADPLAPAGIGPISGEKSSPFDIGDVDRRTEPPSAPDTQASAAAAQASLNLGGPSDFPPLSHPALQESILEAENAGRTALFPAAQSAHVAPERLLLRWAADFGIAMLLERASRSIFASQVKALRILESLGGTATKDQIRPAYDEVFLPRAGTVDALPFDTWLQFLLAWNLVSAHDDKLTIRLLGRALVPYMDSKQYTAYLAN